MNIYLVIIALYWTSVHGGQVRNNIASVQAMYVPTDNRESCLDPNSEKVCEPTVGRPPDCVCMCKRGFFRDSNGVCVQGQNQQPPHCHDPYEMLVCFPCGFLYCRSPCNFMCVCMPGYSRGSSGNCQPASPYGYNSNQPIPAHII